MVKTVPEPDNPLATREYHRQQQFKQIWQKQLDNVFEDVARYYDRANYVASFGLWGWFRHHFISSIDVQNGQRVLDVCAGTHAVGIALLKKQPDLQVYAIDRSKAMLEAGQKSVHQHGMHIVNTIGDAHALPFADNSFDVVTLQFASRHLRVMEVGKEIRRILKPGGHFYHCDMLRPSNKIVERGLYAYLRFSLNLTILLFHSSVSAQDCKDYFIKTLRLFYSADELSELFRNAGFENVAARILLGGVVGYHHAMKPFDK